EGVRAAHFGVEPFRGVQIVIDLRDARVAQAARLLFAQQSETRADAQVIRAADGAYRVQHFLKDALAGRATGDHETEGAGLDACRALGRGEDLFAREQRILGDFRRRDRRLRAVVAVLRTQAALRVEQEVQSHAVLPIVAPHAVGSGELREQRFVRRREHGARIFAPNDFAGQRLSGERIPIAEFVRHRFTRPSSTECPSLARAISSRSLLAAAARASDAWSAGAGSQGKLTTGVSGSNAWSDSRFVARATSGGAPSISFNTTPSTGTAAS